MGMIARMREDIAAVFGRDPAARSTLEVILAYPGLHAIWNHRVAHWLWRNKRHAIASFLQSRVSNVFAVDIHPEATIHHLLWFLKSPSGGPGIGPPLTMKRAMSSHCVSVRAAE